MKTIVLANHKGGCAKTTTALNLSVALAQKGSRVLAVDLDSQGNLSVALGANLEELERTRRTSLRLLLEPDHDYSDYVFEARPRLDLLPCCLDAEIKTALDSLSFSRELKLKRKLEAAQKDYDYCVIDTPPALEVPTLNGLVMADLVIVPVETSLFALVGLSQLLTVIAGVRHEHQPRQLVMALSTMHTSRQVLDRELREKVIERFTGDLVFETCIPRTISVGEATASRRAIVEADQSNPATFAFFQLIAEIKELFNERTQEARTNQRESR
jgi:chromosome partitioning protein